MTPEEIVKRLSFMSDPTSRDAADLIERQATALEVAEKALLEIYVADTNSDMYGLEEGPLAKIADRALATIRKALGE